MSDNSGRMSRWIPAVIMGVATILFSFYALQSQSELVDVRKERDELRSRLEGCEKVSVLERKEATRNKEHVVAVEKQLEECEKTKGK
jgi:hypothetical protein